MRCGSRQSGLTGIPVHLFVARVTGSGCGDSKRQESLNGTGRYSFCGWWREKRGKAPVTTLVVCRCALVWALLL